MCKFILVLLLPITLFGQNPNMKRMLVRQYSASTPFMTFDSVNHGTHTTISNAYLKAKNTSSTGSIGIGNTWYGTGKYYCEITDTFSTAGAYIIGLINSGYTSSDLNPAFLGYSANTWGLYGYSNGTSYHNYVGTSSALVTPVTGTVGNASGNTICIALDLVNHKCYMGWAYGGVSYWFTGSGTTTTFSGALSVFGTLTSGVNYTIAVGYYTDTYVLNDGQSAYLGIMPSGYSKF